MTQRKKPSASGRQQASTQLELPLRQNTVCCTRTRASKTKTAPTEPLVDTAKAPRFRVIKGGGQRQNERLSTRDAVVRVLVETGADVMLRRITPERFAEIQRNVDRVLVLFDKVDKAPGLMSELQRRLDELEALVAQTRDHRHHRRGS